MAPAQLVPQPFKVATLAATAGVGWLAWRGDRYVVDEPCRGRAGRSQAQHEAIASAKDVAELRLAEAKLKAMTERDEAARGKPIRPPVTLAALKAGFFAHSEPGPISFPRADLDGIEMVHAKVAGSDFTGASLRGAKLYSSDLRMTTFDGADLKDALLWSADLRGATFINSDLQGAQLARARLEGADLTGASINREKLTATYDRATKWPAGFDPEAAGCVLVEGPPEAS